MLFFSVLLGAALGFVPAATRDPALGVVEAVFEKLVFPSSGQAGAPIVLTAAPGPRPVLNGTGVNGANMVFINSRSFVTIEGFEIGNNIVIAGPENIVVGSFDPGSSIDNQFDYNLYHGPNPANAEYSLNDQFFTGLAAWQAQTGQDPNSFVADPELLNPQTDDFHVSARSPARDTGDPAFLPESNETDLDGEARLVGDAVDIGVDESGSSLALTPPLESARPSPDQPSRLCSDQTPLGG